MPPVDSASFPLSLPSVNTIRSLASRLRDGVLLYRADGTQVFVNPAAASLCAECYPKDLEHGLSMDKLVPRDALKQARESGHWNGYLSFEESRLLAAQAYYTAEDGGCFLIILQDLRLIRAYDQDLVRRHAELNVRLTAAQENLLQSEKLASIGQLAAGVAHEINNPIGYVHSNLSSLQEYLRSLFALIDGYERALRSPDPKAELPEIDEMRQRLDIDFISQDLPQLLSESREGIERVTQIVRDLKDFSRSDRDESWKMVDLHANLDSTLNIIWNELKYKVTLEKRYGTLPLVECLPSELNQVFMNILLNAGHAVGERGTISLSSGVEEENAWIDFADNGSGIPPETLQRIFDPFFTTKPVGKGTGLGLSISYGIVAKHQGRIEVDSKVGEGTRFRIVLPIRQPKHGQPQ
jgi:signal transduction histidine kinase